ncbi:forkhead box protein L2-like, partial [Penaeus monodon]|uniref:forkhead box protein L2-like n=1 Tax=Penaeus monodon TaxID=6687 RepID=UPI0018A748F2
LSVGAGVVWFVSVVSEEYGAAYGRRTSWSSLYAYRYGWALLGAGGGGVCAPPGRSSHGPRLSGPRHGPSWVWAARGGSGILGRSVSGPGVPGAAAAPLPAAKVVSAALFSHPTPSGRTSLATPRRHLPKKPIRASPVRRCALRPTRPPSLPHSTSIVDLTGRHSNFEPPPPPPRPRCATRPPRTRRATAASITGAPTPCDRLAVFLARHHPR